MKIEQLRFNEDTILTELQMLSKQDDVYVVYWKPDIWREKYGVDIEARPFVIESLRGKVERRKKDLYYLCMLALDVEMGYVAIVRIH